MIAAALAAASVLAVRPSGPVVPANLLRLSLVFDRAPAGPVLPDLELTDASGRTIPAPFLEQELWSPDGRVLTVLLHPGRVKRGLIARELDGPVLVPGETVTLRRHGVPLKRWAVGPARLARLHPGAWRVEPPSARGRRPLLVAFEAPVDALDTDLLAVAGPDGRRIGGEARLVRDEAAWRFTPDRPWAPGAYRLAIHPELEDPMGNRVSQPFEHAAATHEPAPAALAFTIR